MSVSGERRHAIFWGIVQGVSCKRVSLNAEEKTHCQEVERRIAEFRFVTRGDSRNRITGILRSLKLLEDETP
jgi:hypothetical protein